MWHSKVKPICWDNGIQFRAKFLKEINNVLGVKHIFYFGLSRSSKFKCRTDVWHSEKCYSASRARPTDTVVESRLRVFLSADLGSARLPPRRRHRQLVHAGADTRSAAGRARRGAPSLSHNIPPPLVPCTTRPQIISRSVRHRRTVHRGRLHRLRLSGFLRLSSLVISH